MVAEPSFAILSVNEAEGVGQFVRESWLTSWSIELVGDKEVKKGSVQNTHPILLSYWRLISFLYKYWTWVIRRIFDDQSAHETESFSGFPRFKCWIKVKFARPNRNAWPFQICTVNFTQCDNQNRLFSSVSILLLFSNNNCNGPQTKFTTNHIHELLRFPRT